MLIGAAFGQEVSGYFALYVGALSWPSRLALFLLPASLSLARQLMSISRNNGCRH